MPEIKDILEGSKIAGARMIRLIEDCDPSAFEMLKLLYPHSGNAFIIGITGSPGVGKSTLIDALILEFRKLDIKVAVIAVDPTSPISGGAILGDRLRMQRHATDKKVFIRSMASRGKKGGLSRATKDAAVVLDAMGYEIIIVETVGAGQGEFDITTLAHSIGILNIPGTGDGIQTVKAGILETGDVFIVNKSDKPDADELVHHLTMMINMRRPSESNSAKMNWTAKVLKTIARDGTGVKELADTFLSHFAFMKKNGLLDQKRTEVEKLYFKSLLKDLTLDKILSFMETSEEYMKILKKIQSHEMDPLSAAELVANNICVFKSSD
ncbi:MAG: methylmalonyl Co-A mutase-associated GTPase MeaB [Thermodesulfobacteriota bacterium]|nr:methylmalonyl Co-A mutase-associated GTPase MeaB [Thermodesulfobacteriota bacterium]